MLPRTTSWLDSVGAVGFGSSEHGNDGTVCGGPLVTKTVMYMVSQPASTLAFLPTSRFPRTVKREPCWPKSAFRMPSGATVRFPLIRTGPSSTAQPPLTITLPYTPDSSPGEVGVPVQTWAPLCQAGAAAATPWLAVRT